jgi:hypothetical protein
VVGASGMEGCIVPCPGHLRDNGPYHALIDVHPNIAKPSALFDLGKLLPVSAQALIHLADLDTHVKGGLS